MDASKPQCTVNYIANENETQVTDDPVTTLDRVRERERWSATEKVVDQMMKGDVITAHV